MNDLINSFFGTLPFMVTLIWTIILILDYKQGRQARRFLTLFSFVCCLLYFSHAIHFLLKKQEFITWVDSLYTLCHLSVYPIYYIYIRLLTDSSKLKFKELLILLPAVIIASAEVFELEIYGQPKISLFISDIVFPLQIILVYIFGRIKLLKYNKTISNYYSATEGKTVENTLIILFVFFLSSSASVIANIVGRDTFLGSPMLAIPSTILTILIFAVLYIGYKQRFEASKMQEDIAKEKPETTTSYIQEDEELMKNIRRAMEKKELFRNKGLKISDVASEVMSNRTYVSQSINQYTGQTFSEFVNTYRIEYAKKKLVQDKRQSISIIGEDSGFAVESTFFRNFKQVTGKTPAEWRAEN